jgi:N-formylglutamate amidohydrolase
MPPLQPFIITHPATKKVPIVISVPHCGAEFPEEIQDSFHPELIKSPDDTDWYVDHLYDFAGEMGITMISSKFSRWVIDLNRDPKSKPLYTDGRIITDLVPKTTFTGKTLSKEAEPDEYEIQRRIVKYYQPYHQKLEELLAEIKSDFGKVLLWEAHSIREYVPTIHPDKFPDLILGDADGTSATPEIISIAHKELGKGHYHLSHNSPFKGGFITRKFGDPENGVHALQLEMTKVNYMDDAEVNFDEERARKMRALLVSTFKKLIRTLS